MLLTLFRINTLFFLILVSNIVNGVPLFQEFQNVDQVHRDDVIVDGRFYTDSLSLGEHLKYIITLEYPREYEAILPGEKFNFQPFEYIKTYPSRTVSNDSISRDSVVFILTSFQLDSIQNLALPIQFINEKGDQFAVTTDTVSLFFKSRLLSTVPLIVDIPATGTDIHFSMIRDYQGWSLIFLILGLLLVVLALYFRKPIYIYLTEKRLSQSHNAFILKYEKTINAFNNSPKEAEEIIAFWKSYMEKLVKKPYTKYTQKDFKKSRSTKEIANVMQDMEKLIYGNQPTDTTNNFKILLAFASEKYKERIIKLKAGKKS